MQRLSILYIASIIALVLAACTKPSSPTLGEVVDEFRELRNESTRLSCECFELLVVDYASEQECIDHVGLIETENLECIVNVVELVTRDEEEAVELVQCYNDVFRESVACKQANVGVCSADIFGDCAEQFARTIADCEAGYPEEDLESLWYCWP